MHSPLSGAWIVGPLTHSAMEELCLQHVEEAHQSFGERSRGVIGDGMEKRDSFLSRNEESVNKGSFLRSEGL